MTAKKTHAIPAAKLALYDKLIATDPSIERKGATIPYTSANGKMFTYLSPTGDLRLRLPADEREAFMKTHRTKLALSNGVVMKEFVAVPSRLFARTGELKPYLALSRGYAERLGMKKGTKRTAPLAKKRPRAG